MLVKYGDFEPPFPPQENPLFENTQPLFYHHQPKWQNFVTKNRKKRKKKKEKKAIRGGDVRE
jgi:hypothetical protein